MGTRKKASELVFNLQWRQKQDNGADKSNVIGMYDTPMTTSNFDMFKSYLLKNSGVAGNDVKVTYLTDNGQEWVIDSQEMFVIALSAFRLKARLGEVIFLKLDKISGAQPKGRKYSNDVETQFDVEVEVAAPPEWFVAYMKQFKRDIVEEVTFAVTSNLTDARGKEPSHPPAVIPKKAKLDPAKRCRKHIVSGEHVLDMDFLKTLKFDRKLESKLDKLDAKTKKIKEKKQALINKISCGDDKILPQKQSPVAFEPVDLVLRNASLVNAANAENCEHMVGGEIYLHCWEVVNSGHLPWTENTELCLTWGSADLIPSVRRIRCPPLKPGEKGKISIRFEVPKKPGTYESYWNFYEKDIRFGSTLSCYVIVEEPLSSILSPEKKENVEEPRGIKKLQKQKAKKEPEIVSFPVSGEYKMIVPDSEKAEELKTYPSGMRFSRQIIFPHGIEEGAVPNEEKITRCIIFPDGVGGPNPKCCIVPNTHPELPKKENPQTNENDQKNNQMIFFPEKTVEENEKMAEKTDSIAVIDLSSRIQSLRLAGYVDSDFSDMESVCCYGNNKYGIQEKDLIVDLSKTSKDSEKVEEKGEEEEEKENNLNEDKNNNNGSVDNNNSSGESISEIASEASSLTSGYDVVNAPECEEREDGSGYVYITIDGNKLPVPRHILRPDFLATAEEAPAPSPSDDEIKPKIATQEPTAPSNPEPSQCSTPKLEPQDPTLMSHCSATGSCFSEANPNARLFIFPQSNPGYEVVYPSLDPLKTEAKEATQGYSWAKSETQYTLADMASAQLRTDPYGPLDQSRSSAQPQDNLQHVPNFQQGGKIPPSAPPRSTPPTSEFSPVNSPPPVHILPENLVTGAVNVASSAINTARSVINMIVPPKLEPGKWVNGHWVTENPESLRAKNLLILAEMGFWDADLNASLLARYNDDLARVVSDLVQ